MCVKVYLILVTKEQVSFKQSCRA